MQQHRLMPGGGPRLAAGSSALLAALLTAVPAAAQLPPPGEAVRDVAAPVQEAVQQPLPSPLEEIVQDSPVEPLRDTVQDVVGPPGGGLPSEVLPPGGQPGGNLPRPALPGVDLPGGGQPSQGAPSASSAGAADGGASRPSQGGGSPPSSGPGDGRNGGSAERDGGGRAADRDERPARAADEGTPAAGTDRTGAATGGDRGAGDGADDEQSRLARTVERIVEVVPGFVWAALGLLALLSTALGVRSLIDRRRTRALLRERQRLLHDMGLLERVLLPQVPERLGDLAASVAYRPAAGPAAGGDFYDVFELPDGRVALLVGDVSGHGREALERTSAVRPALRGHLEAGLSPRAALESAGRAAGVDPAGGFTTVIVAVHDPDAGTLTYAAAGHPPPILVGPGAHDPLTVSSAPPIGVGIRTGLRQTTVSLPRGAAACFVTDGLLEARRGDELLGREWVAGVVGAFGALDTASALLDRVMEEADSVPDDMTACVVRAVSGPERAGPRIEELQLEPDDVGAAAPERFLEACGVAQHAIGPAIAEARRLAVRAGAALLTVTIDGGEASVRVTAPTREALATT